MTTTTQTQITVPGTRIVSTRGVPGGRGYTAPGIYEATARADGVLTWRHVEDPLGCFWFQGRQMVTGYRSAAKAARVAEELAEARGIEFASGVRHGRVCE